MAIKVHRDRNLFEDIRENNEFENSEQFEENKLKEYQDTALSRVMNAADGTSDTGLRGVFEDLGIDAKNNRIPRNITPDSLVDFVSGYVEQIIEGSFDDVIGNLAAPTSSLAANMERQVLANSADDVRDEIFANAAAGNRSISAVKTIQDFNTSVLQPEILHEYSKVEKQNKEFIDKYDSLEKKWFKPRRNKKIRRAHKYDELNTKFRENLDKQFSDWNKKAKEIENDQDRQIGLTQRMIEHKIAHGTDEERNQRAEELMSAVKYGHNNLGFGKLEFFYPGGADPQQKINFLEAANQIDWVTEGVTASKVLEKNSETIKKQLKVGEEIEDLFRNTGKFKVKTLENLKKDSAFKDLPELTEDVSAKELVTDIKHDLEFLKKNIPDKFKNYLYGDLLDDEPKFMIFLNYIWSDASIRKGLSETTRAKIVKWFEQLDGETKSETYEKQSDVEKLQKELKDQSKKLPTRAKQLASTFQERKITDDKNSFKKFKTDAENFNFFYSQKRQEFENQTTNLPEKDVKELKESWDKVDKFLDFFIKSSAEWLKNKKAHDAWEKTNEIAKEAVAEAKRERGRFEIASPSAKKSRLESIENHAERAANRLSAAQSKYQESIETEPTLTDFSVDFAEYSQVFPTLAKKKFETTKDKTPHPLDLYKRAQQKLFKNFNEEKLEQQLLKNLKKETDIEVLKKAAPRSKLEVTYTETVPTSFGDIENGSETKTFRIVRRDEKGLYLEQEEGTGNLTMKIAMNPVHGEGESLMFAENMELGKKSAAGGPRQFGTALNFKIAA